MSHVIRWLWSTQLLNSTQVCYILLKLVAIVLAKVEIKHFLISRDHIINDSRDSMGAGITN